MILQGSKLLKDPNLRVRVQNVTHSPSVSAVILCLSEEFNQLFLKEGRLARVEVAGGKG